MLMVWGVSLVDCSMSVVLMTMIDHGKEEAEIS